MECNRDEAKRAREIAKRKFLANDVSGARKFALKAQMLYPELNGITQMIATFDVHLSARNTIDGERDYYSVFGLKPDADDGTVRKQYRKLAVTLHPDRNKSVGAEEAFKYLSQAWCVFSDKIKRAEYDQRRNLRLHEKSSTLEGTSSANPSINGTHKVTKTSGSTSKAKNSKRGTNRAGDASVSAAASSSSLKKRGDGTFWTVCKSCRTQYEYHRVYLNQNLLCPNCRKPFIAVETAPPGSGSIRKSFNEHQFNSHHQTASKKKTASVKDDGMYGDYDSYGQANLNWNVYSGTQNTAAASGSQRDEGVRRKYTKRIIPSSTTNASKRRKNAENPSAAKPGSVKEITEQELNNVIKRKTMQEIRRLLQEPHVVTETDVAAKRRKTEGEENNGCHEELSESKAIRRDDIHETRCSEPLTVDVPDPDFCDFDKDRTERSFSENQIWALYDSFDGMPRCYAKIHKVASTDPFKVRISFLTSEMNDLDSLKWLGHGTCKTCGEFRVGKPSICKSLNVFSHQVSFTTGSNAKLRIYPRKGEVWALYKNWCPDWNCLVGGETVKYDIVEVVEGYSEYYGVTVVPLVKVAGFKAVFHHHLDHRQVRRIPIEEISRFSHRIPSYLLTGRESATAPKGCRQLDPAATPSDFLKVIGYETVQGDLMEEEAVSEEGVVDVIDLDGTEREMRESPAQRNRGETKP